MLCCTDLETVWILAYSEFPLLAFYGSLCIWILGRGCCINILGLRGETQYFVWLRPQAKEREYIKIDLGMQGLPEKHQPSKSDSSSNKDVKPEDLHCGFYMGR